jgi:putative ABC transport system permease protein
MSFLPAFYIAKLLGQLLTLQILGEIMFKNYLKIALRNIGRHKMYSVINILGLSVGIATAIIVYLVVQGELCFESHHSQNIYRINKKYTMKGVGNLNESTPHPLRESLANEIPEVVSAVHITNSSCLLKYDDKVFRERDNFYASTNIFEMFSFNFILGSAEDAIPDNNSIAISQSTATKYFGDENPIGKILIRNNRSEMTVTAVFEDMPIYTNYNFQTIQNISSVTYEDDIDNWYSHWMETFILIDDTANFEDVQTKVDGVMKAHLEEQSGAVLQSLKNIHLYSVEGNPTAQKYIYIFGSVAILILIIACINFMNLATAQATKRAREVGVRKIAGAQKKSLIFQFIGESIIYTILAFLFSLLLVELSLPIFEQLTGRAIALNLLNPIMILSGIGGIILLGIISGSYPAVILSSYSPVNIFKSNLVKGGKGLTMRTIIVIVQFTLAISLLIGTGIIYTQLQYMQKKDLGFDNENLLVLRMNPDLKEKFETFTNMTDQIPGVQNITRSSSTPNEVWNIMRGMSWEGNISDEGSAFAFISADANFVETVDLEIVQGRNFDVNLKSDENAVLINEKSIEMMGVENPLGLKMGDDGFEIIGVVKDFNSLPLNYEIEPLLIAYIPDYFNLVILKLSGDNIVETIEQLEQIWLDICPDFPFNHRFLDDTFQYTYDAEIKAGILFRVFAGLGIFIACLGLFGLASFLTEQKKLEIGVRKVMGSSSSGIIWQLSKQFVRWVIVANVIAWPLAWYVMKAWLNGFVYHTSTNPLIFIFAGVVSLAIALITISLKTWKAANTNPAKILKYE